jgi:predicted transcriptional regulator
MAMLTLRVRDEIDARIAELAKTSGRTKTYWVTRLIELGLAELEYELWQEQALKRFLAEKKVTAAELESDLNMTMEFDAYIMEAEGNPELQGSADEVAGVRPKKDSGQA